jgi:hypothetical protein
LGSLNSWAGRADPFRGIYDILSETNMQDGQPFFLLDADTLGALWGRYGNGPLPADLEHLRNEPSIIAGFNNRELLFFGLEKGALIGNGYIALQGGDGEQLELRHRPDGKFDMATKEKGVVTVYLLAAPRPLPPAKESR